MLTICFVLACFVTVVMLLWFKSDFIIEYIRLLRFKKVYRDFKDERMQAAPELFTFPHYLRKKWDCWLTRLLVCPLCFCVWCSSTVTLGATILLLMPLVLVATPVIIVLSLILYGVITKLVHNL